MTARPFAGEVAMGVPSTILTYVDRPLGAERQACWIFSLALKLPSDRSDAGRRSRNTALPKVQGSPIGRAIGHESERTNPYKKARAIRLSWRAHARVPQNSPLPLCYPEFWDFEVVQVVDRLRAAAR